MKRIIYSAPDGGVAIIIPAGTIEDCIKDVPPNTSYKIVDVSDIPVDRTFRNAWEWQEPA
jgi:hypothetical protein